MSCGVAWREGMEKEEKARKGDSRRGRQGSGVDEQGLSTVQPIQHRQTASGHRSELVLAQPPVSCQFTSAGGPRHNTAIGKRMHKPRGVATAQQDRSWDGERERRRNKPSKPSGPSVAKSLSSICLHDRSMLHSRASQPKSKRLLPDLDLVGSFWKGFNPPTSPDPPPDRALSAKQGTFRTARLMRLCNLGLPSTSKQQQ